MTMNAKRAEKIMTPLGRLMVNILRTEGEDKKATSKRKIKCNSKQRRRRLVRWMEKLLYSRGGIWTGRLILDVAARFAEDMVN